MTYRVFSQANRPEMIPIPTEIARSVTSGLGSSCSGCRQARFRFVGQGRNRGPGAVGAGDLTDRAVLRSEVDEREVDVHHRCRQIPDGEPTDRIVQLGPHIVRVQALILNGRVILLEGEQVDWTGDGQIDGADQSAAISNFTSSGGVPGLAPWSAPL